MINFNKPFLTGKETHYIYQAVHSGKISGNGIFTKKCHNFFCDKYGFKKNLLTSSCTDALEMCALLLNIKENDEVIVPSYTFVSSALAFVRQGAKIVFADSSKDAPCVDIESIESKITLKTKAIVVVHYAGVAVDMDKIMDLAVKYNIKVIEDAAQAIDSYYKGQPLGGIGHLGVFSFHETKNIISGEGGLLIINDEQYIERAEVLWEKGTNRASFFRGEINKYGWVDTGSSFLPSEITAAFLWAQLENLEQIQERRKYIWNRYWEKLQPLKDLIGLPLVPRYSTNNAHMFYILTNSLKERTALIKHLKDNEILAVFHYQSLHKSKFYLRNNREQYLPNSDKYSDQLLRLPLFYELTNDQIDSITDSIIDFYKLSNHNISS